MNKSASVAKNIIETKHYIQRHILQVLARNEFARFRDMRPPRTETNLYTYHLNKLLRSGMIEKTNGGYTLSDDGLQFVDRITLETGKPRVQSKIITMTIVQDGYGNILLQRRNKQPYINTWALPYGKIHIDDDSVLTAAMREQKEKIGQGEVRNLRHVGDTYIRTYREKRLITSVFVHVCRYESDDIEPNDDMVWVSPVKLLSMDLSPGVEQIVTRAFFNDEFFFEEYAIDY